MINVELMRSISGMWNKEVLCHSYSPLLSGAWVKLPLSHTKRLASLLSEKWNSLVMGWLRCFVGHDQSIW